MFLKIPQISQENTCVGVCRFRPATLLKRGFNSSVTMKFAKFLITLFFYRAPFYSDCFCLFWKSGENFISEQLTNPMLAGNNFTENFPADVPVGWEFFGTCKTIPQLFLLLSWALWNFELYYICAALWKINNAVILSFQNVIFQKNKLKNRNNVKKIKLCRNCERANLSERMVRGVRVWVRHVL